MKQNSDWQQQTVIKSFFQHGKLSACANSNLRAQEQSSAKISSENISYTVWDTGNGWHVTREFQLLLTSFYIPEFQSKVIGSCHLCSIHNNTQLKWVSEQSIASRLIHVGYFGDESLQSFLHWYWQLKTNKRKYTKNTKIAKQTRPT